MRALLFAAFLSVSACATQPPDPLAFEAQQTTIPGMSSVHTDGPVGPAMIPPVTAICRDGWFSYSQQRRGTCSGHGGVREWGNRPPR
jgi:hypothetical protein